MYTPEQFAENDPNRICELISSNPFGMLITVDEGYPSLSHLPFIFESNAGSHGKLIAHMAKDNPQWKSLLGSESVVVVFNGAHGYISPTMYSNPGVPTWNYAAVLLHGKPVIFEDPVEIEKVLEKTSAYFESGRPNAWKLSFPVEKNKLLRMIVGFEINIQKIEGKFKLSQNRTAQEQQNIISELANSNNSGDIELSKFMKSYYEDMR